MEKNAKIYVAGHRGLVGSAIWKNLQDKGYTNLIGRTHKELDLLDGMAVRKFFDEEQPEYVFLAAAFVGGIMANSIYRADFIYKNLQIQQNIIGESFRHNVKKLLFLGSTCIYPRDAEQPMKEDVLLTSPLEYTNEPYAIAKIAGLKMCESFNLQYGTNYIAVMPTNLYGPNDNFDLERSHVLPAMLRKFITAKANNDPSVTIWGTGTPKREFLHVDDLAEACMYLMEHYNEKGLVNIGTGIDVTILELAQMVKQVTGYAGEIVLDLSKPDGTPRKLMDVSKINQFGWKARIDLHQGISMVYELVKNSPWNK